MTDLSELAVKMATLRLRHTDRIETGPLSEERDCETHGKYIAQGKYLSRIDRTVWTRCEACKAADEAVVAAANAERSRAAKEAAAERALKVSNMPKRFAGRRFENFIATNPKQTRALTICRDFAESFPAGMASGSSLVLSGPPGTGKTHLAASVMHGVMADGYSVQYVTCMDMIRAVRGTWRKDSARTEDDVLRELGETLDLLVIDEIGVQYGTEGEQTVVFDVLDRRYREMRPTILISNADSKQFQAYVGDRVFDRLREVARWVPFEWDSYRPVARQGERGAA